MLNYVAVLKVLLNSVQFRPLDCYYNVVGVNPCRIQLRYYRMNMSSSKYLVIGIMKPVLND